MKKNPTFDGRQREDTEIDCNNLPDDSTIKDSAGEDLVDRKMKGLNCKPRYQFISFLHEILLFFIISLLLFPSHVKRIILCFVYSYDHQPAFIYPSLEEEILQPPHIADVDPISLPQPIHKDDLLPIESDHPCDLEEIETDSIPSQISTHFSITSDPCHRLFNPHDQPTTF
jgi:hypothetical protein